MSASNSLRALLQGDRIIQVMAAHSPLSALLAQEAGFDAVWASGFELSALLGLPDASLISMTQHLEMTRLIAGRIQIPVIADLDSGFGNAVNVMHTVREYERAGVSAVVLEDKTFPKMTSLLPGGRQELVRVEEFQGKIKAALAARADPELIIIARVEALIAGQGLQEALKRAKAYEAAGADMILIHSKQKTPAEIEAFVAAWDGRAPLVVIPTSYPQLGIERVRELRRIRMVIHGNHAIRACVKAMQETFAAIRVEGSASGVADRIATVEEIFRLQGMADLLESELRFLR